MCRSSAVVRLVARTSGATPSVFPRDLVFFISSCVLMFFLWQSSVFFMSELNVIKFHNFM